LGLAQIAESVGGTLGNVIGSIGTDLIAGDLKSVWDTVVKGMATLWADFCEGMVAMFTLAARGVTTAWEAAVGAISDAILETSSQGGVLGKAASAVLGVDIQAEQARANKLNAQLGLGPQNITDEAKEAARQQTASTANAAREFLDKIDQGMQARSDAARDAFKGKLGGGAKAAGDEAKRLEAELAALAAEAARAKEAAKTAAAEEAALPGEPSAASVKQASFSTFSASALIAAGGGGSPVDRLIRIAERHVKVAEEMAKDIVRLRDKPVPGLRP
jgi:hypothetical protein